MAAVLLSFLFFARNQDTYDLLLLSGLTITGVCFLWIILGKGATKEKLFWTGVIAFGILLNRLTESYFISTSYRIYLKQHDKELIKINDILKSKPGEIWILNDSITEKGHPSLSASEKQALLQERQKLGVYLILKQDSTIYYGLWGFLDVRLGLTYSISGELQNNELDHLTGNWFK